MRTTPAICTATCTATCTAIWKMRSGPLVALLLISLPLVGCGDQPAQGHPGPPTYYQDVAAVLQKRCTTCHQPNNLGPFPLDSWDAVSKRVPLIAAAVGGHVMPPFPPAQDQQDQDCPSIDDPRVMPDAERELIARWVAAGAPAGDPMPLPQPPSPYGTLGPPTDKFPMVDTYTSTFSDSDDYRCFLIDPHLTALTAVTAVSAEPGNRAIVHHAAVFAIPPEQVAVVKMLDDSDPGPGYTCFGGAGLAQAYPVGLWVPGLDAPPPPPRAGVGFWLPAGWQFILQNHYNFGNGRGSDRSSVTLWRASGLILEVPHALALGDYTLFIPAGAKSTTSTVTGDIVPFGAIPSATQTQQGVIYSAWAHEHLLGRSFKIDLIHADGRQQCILHIPSWNFHWQAIYRIKHPVLALPGDHLRVTCEWDNSPANQPYIGGVQQTTHDVRFGEKSTDEMCIGSVGLLNY